MKRSRESVEETLAKRYVRNRCSSCGSDALPGKTRCDSCSTKNKEKAKQRHKDWLDAGLCPSCGKSPAPGRKCCQVCLDKALMRSKKLRLELVGPVRPRETFKERYARRKADGICVACAVAYATDGQVHCEGCKAQRGTKNKSADPLRGKRPKNYAERRALGLCGLCGKVPPVADYISCQACLDKTRARQERAKDKNKKTKVEIACERAAHGTCVRCAQRAAVAPSLFCLVCIEVTRADNTKNHYIARRRIGICVNCDEKAVEGKARCVSCQTKYKEQRAELVKQGVCVRCKQATDAGVFCSSCRTRDKEWKKVRRAKWLATGLCGKCGDPATVKKLCQPCSDKNKVEGIKQRRRLKDAAYAAYGGYRCACCGCDKKAFLQLDHVNNDGHKHRRELSGKNVGGGIRMYYWLKQNNYPEGLLQPLCANCNFAKAHSPTGRCPYQDPIQQDTNS